MRRRWNQREGSGMHGCHCQAVSEQPGSEMHETAPNMSKTPTTERKEQTAWNAHCTGPVWEGPSSLV